MNTAPQRPSTSESTTSIVRSPLVATLSAMDTGTLVPVTVLGVFFVLPVGGMDAGTMLPWRAAGAAGFLRSCC